MVFWQSGRHCPCSLSVLFLSFSLSLCAFSSIFFYTSRHFYKRSQLVHYSGLCRATVIVLLIFSSHHNNWMLPLRVQWDSGNCLCGNSSVWQITAGKQVQLQPTFSQSLYTSIFNRFFWPDIVKNNQCRQQPQTAHSLSGLCRYLFVSVRLCCPKLFIWLVANLKNLEWTIDQQEKEEAFIFLFLFITNSPVLRKFYP